MDAYPKTIMLPISGKTAVIERRIKARDMRMAYRIAGRDSDEMFKSFAMIAQVVTLNGQPVLMEDVDDWDLDDLNEVFAALGIGEKKLQTQPLSPPLSNGASGQVQK